VAGFWAKMLETDHVEDKTFQANFFRDFQSTLAEHPPVCSILLSLLSSFFPLSTLL
jgi:hypothetical protein